MKVAKKQLLLGAITMSAVVIFASVFLVWAQLQPVDSSSKVIQRVVITKGESVTSIAQKLEDKGLIRSALFFKVVIRFMGIGNQLQAGSFELSPAQPPTVIATTLTQGTEDIWITILEGWRNEETAEYLAEQELTEFDKEVFLEELTMGQNIVFPETYLVPREMSEEQLAELFSTQYMSFTFGNQDKLVPPDGYTYDEMVVMASLIQREARTYEQMQHVSGILWNRLELGMPLQVDATLQYIKGKDASGKWWSTPLAADKQLQSPFNTYLNSGLPPSPICNPGKDALLAAANPLDVDDLFYLHSPTGEMYFAQTLEQHNANINKYLR